MDFWKLSAHKKAVIVGVLSLVLTFSGVDTRGVAAALAETMEPANEAGQVVQGAAESSEEATSEAAETTLVAAEEDAAAQGDAQGSEGADSGEQDSDEGRVDGELSAVSAQADTETSSSEVEAADEPEAVADAETTTEPEAATDPADTTASETASTLGAASVASEPSAVSSADVDVEALLDKVEQEVRERGIGFGSEGGTLSAQDDSNTAPISSFSLTWDTADGKTDGDDSTLSLYPGLDEFTGTFSGDDTPLSMQASLAFSLAGESDYEPGAIQITIPTQFIKDRSEAYIGSMSVNLPEEPDSSQYFAYRLVTPDTGDPYYVITNTRVLPSSTEGTIQFTYSDITPHEVVSAYASGYEAPQLNAQMDIVATGGGSVVASATANTLRTKIYTEEMLDDAQVNGGTVVSYADAPGTVRAALDKVSGSAESSASNYVLVRWNTYATVKGNQTFTLTMKDELTGTYNNQTHPAIKCGNETAKSTGSVVLGTSTLAPTTAGSTSFTKDIFAGTEAGASLTSGYLATGETCYETVWTAYPTSLFESGKEYTITNSVTWTLNPTDSGAGVSRFKTASITYTKPSTAAFPESVSNYYAISKETLDPHKYSTSDNTALNELSNEDVTVGFTVSASGEIMSQTKAAGDETPNKDIADRINDGTATVDDYFHKQYVTVEASDDVLYLNGNYTSELGSGDYYVSQVSVNDPLVYTYDHKDGDATQDWTFQRNTTGRLPNMAIYGLSETSGGTAGTWTKLATVSYNESNARTVSAVASGVTASSDGITIDSSLLITRVKLIASTKTYDKIELSYSPYITLCHDSTRIASLLAELYANSTTPMATIRNDATLLAYNGDAVGGTKATSIDPTIAQITTSDKIIALTRNLTPTLDMKRTAELDVLRYGTYMEHGSSFAYLRGVTPQVGVTSAKSCSYDSSSDLDTTAMQAKLHYTATVHEQSNVTSRALYNSYTESGAILRETSGTWYDLLPPGVEPDLSSITLRDADTIVDAYTITNYKDSGRTLLVVKANLVPVVKYSSSSDYWAEGFYDEPKLSFDAVYSYADYDDSNDTLVNVIAFESGYDALGNVDNMKGEYDDATGGSGTEKVYQNSQTAGAVSGVEDLMSNLDSALTEKKPTFVYARNETKLEISRTVTSSTKTAATDAEGIYRVGAGENATQVNVSAGQGYSYRINVGSSSDASNIVIYDALESYVPNGSDPDTDIAGHTWKGTFSSVDTSKLTAAGATDVKVYYSTSNDITSSTISTYTTLTDTNHWSTTPPTDLSTVTAIAIDCGSEFTLTAGSSVPVYIHMTAPDSTSNYKTVNSSGSEDNPDSNSHAFNSAYITMGDSDPGSSTDYTKVGILPYKVTVSKVWDDGDNQDGVRPTSVTVSLLANGETAKDTSGIAISSVTLNSSNSWTYTYSNLPSTDSNGKAIRYTVTEGSVDGYTPSYLRLDDTHLQITNKHVPDTVEVCGTITWKDNADAAGKRPSNVLVRLYADGVYQSLQRVGADANGTWSYAFTDLPAKKSGGTAITYTVKEDTVDYYAADYTTSTSGTTQTTDITNTYATTGYLAIAKTVEGAKSSASKNAQFKFTVELFDPTLKDDNDKPQPLYGSYPYYLVDSEGATVEGSAGTVSTGGTIALVAGQKAIITGIPANSTYKVTEQSAAGFSLTSSENTNGTVTAGVDASDAVVASFTNTYSSTGSFQLQVTKELTGQKLARGMFQFKAYLVDGASEQLVSTASNRAGSELTNNKSTGEVVFSRINVTNEDLGEDGTLTRTYRIREVIPAGATDNNDGTYTYNGYTYDAGTEEINVTLTDNGDGTISAVQTPASGSDATFANAYVAAGSFDIVAYKYLAGGTLSADMFEFTLAPLTSGAPTASDMTAKNDAEGTITFPPIALTATNAGKSYIYKVTENAGSDANVTYSTAVVYYRVDVTDDGTGTLTAATSVVTPTSGATDADVADGVVSAFESTGASPTITNSLKPGSLSIEKKLAEGSTDPDGNGTSFTFQVRLVGNDIEESYAYTVGDEKKIATVTDGVMTLSLTAGQKATIAGIAAGTSYQVFEEPQSGWQLSAQTGASGTIAANATSAAEFTNAVASSATATTHLYASKTLDGEAPATGTFNFTLTGKDNAPMPSNAKVSNDATGLVDFGAITYSAAGTYTYTIAEVLPEGVSASSPTKAGITYDTTTWTAVVTVGDTGTTESPALSITSVTYKKGTDAASGTTPVFANSTEGKLTVKNQGTNVTEQNQNDVFDVTVELTNGGKPIYHTSYYVGSDTAATKDSINGIYHITLKPGETAHFEGLPEGTTYTVYEASRPTGWTQTATTGTRGTISVDDTAAATITNTYNATGSISLQAIKTMASGALVAGQFSFQLYETVDQTETLLQTKGNLAPSSGTATGKIVFDQIDYTFADIGTHTYTMQEVVPDDAVQSDTEGNKVKWSEATDDQKAAGGFTYEGVIYGSGTGSSLVQTVTVTVADAGSGKLTVTPSNIDSSGNVTTEFENTVSTGSLKVATTATGMNEAVKDTEFKYSIQLTNSAAQSETSYDIKFYDASGTEVDKYSTDGDDLGKKIEKVTFSSSGLTEGITNIKSGEYFVISGLPAGTTYQVNQTDSTYGFTQVASTNDQGTIEADGTAEASFTNAYAVEGSIVLQAQATLTNAATQASMTDHAFTFQLYDEANNLLQTKKTDSTGFATFDAVEFQATDAGTEDNPQVHKFRIVQVDDSQQYVVYDTHSGWVNVSVSDDGTDQAAELKISASYEHASGTAANETPETFANIYQISWKLPTTGGSGLAVPMAIVVIVASAAGAYWMHRRRRKV